MLLGSGNTSAIEPDLPRWPPQLDDTRLKIVTCADSQMAQGIRFSASYYGMDYPWGDVPSHVGTSPDLVIRCLREAGIDLQQMVHIDRKRRPRHYPLHIWGHPRPDRSIDHRRIPNLYTFVQTYFERQSIRVDSAEKCAGFIPGDIVFWAGQGGSEYPNMTGLVTDRRNEEGVPYVVTLHRDDRVVTDSHLLTDWTVTGHYQVDRDALLHRFLTEHPSANLLARPIP